jgi:DNA-binding transcriptional MerR regulator
VVDRNGEHDGSATDRRQASALDDLGHPSPTARRDAGGRRPRDERYTIADLQRETGVSPRTIRYYITQGLLPPAHGRGPSATYDRGHLLRLHAVKRQKERFLPLETIKLRLGDLTDEEIEAEIGVESLPSDDRWRRVRLHDDVELHVRERAGFSRDRAFESAVEQLIEHARLVIRSLPREEG